MTSAVVSKRTRARGSSSFRPDDPRFAGKALPIRNLVIVGGLSLIFPARSLIRRSWDAYPVWLDNLYLSIFWLDMAGNSFDLYDRFAYFDLIPHFHGTGAATVVIQRLLGLPVLTAVGLANILHLLLEVQEYYTDVLAGTRNVHGAGDVVNDLLVGLLGTALYGGASYVLSKCRRLV